MMEIDSDDEILRTLAGGGSMDYSLWPALLSTIISRLDKIAHNDFPIPVFRPRPSRRPLPEPRFLAPLPSSDPIGPSDASDASSLSPVGKRKLNDVGDELNHGSGSEDSSQETADKENANPAPSTGAAPASSAGATSTTDVAPSSPPRLDRPTQLELQPQQEDRQERDPVTLPPLVASQLSEITSTLSSGFPSRPPHTIQRLAELVLRPRQHYRSLPSYLHAVDRVVHVISGADAFPLPPAVPEAAAMTALANGFYHNNSRGGRDGSPSSTSSSSSSRAGGGSVLPPNWSASAAATGINPGSDEALGGALLTPIPWLTRRPASADGGGGGGSSSGAEDNTLSPVDGDSSPTEASSLSAAMQQQQQSHSPAAARQRRQQRLSTESTETIEGPNGMGHIETVSVSVNGVVSHGAATNALAASMARASSSSPTSSSAAQHQRELLQQGGVTQGELLREEQRANVVPASQLQRSGRTAAAASSSATRREGDENDGDDDMADADSETKSDGAADGQGGGDEDEDETPHVRGPQEIGLADTGPQAAGTTIPAAGATAPTVEMGEINVEAAVGRPADESGPSRAANDSGAAAAAAPQPSTSTPPDRAGDAVAPFVSRAERSQTPKRSSPEHDDPAAVDDESPPAKKAKLHEDDDVSDASASASAPEPPPPLEESKGPAGEPAPKVDGDGDVVIGDDSAVAAVPDDKKGEDNIAEEKKEQEPGGSSRETKDSAADSASSATLSNANASAEASDDKMAEG